MIAGYALKRAHDRDLLAWHAAYLMQSTGNYEKGSLPTLRDLLGRDPLPLDSRWPAQAEDDLSDEELERLAEDDAEARRHTFQAAGYPMGKVSAEEYARMLRESKAP